VAGGMEASPGLKRIAILGRDADRNLFVRGAASKFVVNVKAYTAFGEMHIHPANLMCVLA